MFSFLHAADIHLDSPLKGLDRYEGAPVDALRGSTRDALSAWWIWRSRRRWHLS